ncbi:hypothetical protein ACVDG5_035655 [Mesorhizobium sp. ORM6]
MFDVFTGQPVSPDGWPAIGLDMEYADDLVDLLNVADLKRRLSQGRFI